MKFLKITAILGLLHSSAGFAAITDLVWPLGERTCIGTWSYNEMNQCQFIDKNTIIYEDGVTYPRINKTCGSWTFGEEVVDSKDMPIEISSRSSVKDFRTLTNWCNYQAKPTISVDDDLHYYKDGQYLPDRITQKWALRDVRIEGSTGICHLELVNQPVKQDAYCGTEDDLQHPTKKFKEYGKKISYDPSCGVTARTLSYGSSIAVVLENPATVKASAVCSTDDGSLLDSKAAVQSKATLLHKELLAALRMDNSFCTFKGQLAEYTQLFVKEKASDTPVSQQGILNSISNLLLKKCNN